ncbi:AraC family transcriptional regulator [Spirochaetia bacterium]|nr:AraC family transcriptional regulator [Spirochaetia bacterium]
MEPWQEKVTKEKFAYSFPFRSWDIEMPDFAYPLHYHNFYEILTVLKGETFALIDGQGYKLEAGDSIIISLDQIHGFFNSSTEMHGRIYQFAPEVFGEGAAELWNSIARQSVFVKKPLITSDDAEANVDSILGRIHEEYCRHEAGFRLSITAELIGLALLYVRKSAVFSAPVKKVINGNADNRQLEKVLSFIFKNFDKPGLKLEEAASCVSISKFHFTRFFKKQTGWSFHDYLSMVRISHAKERLVRSNTPIIDIAYSCGFASLQTFNRVFKAYTGSTPSVYRSVKNTSFKHYFQ